MIERFGQQPDRLICNQITPFIVQMIAEAAGVPLERAILNGQATGHCGPIDMVSGLQILFSEGDLNESVAVAASTVYAFGAGLLTPANDKQPRIT
jgi:3-oxoacyl-[acyl-carrier-protein] synthase III